VTAKLGLVLPIRPTLALAVLTLPAVAQQTQGQLDGNPSIFGALAAIQAAGLEAEPNSLSSHPLRQQLREHLAKQKLPSVDELKKFLSSKQKDPNLLFSQVVSWALTVDGPPNFLPAHKDQIPPPDAAALEGLAPILGRFWKEANLDQIWKQVQPAYDEVIAKYHPLVTRAVMEVNAFLRNPTSGYLGRRFQIYVDLIGPPNQVQSRSYADDYFVVVTSAKDLPIDDIRHGYLHYLIDPLGLKFSEQLNKKRGLIDYAQGSPILEDHYKNDFVLLATECFIKAVESRLSRKPALIDQALREGFVVTPAFSELLAVYEKQEVAMRLYFPELVNAIDLRKEEKRLDHIEFASSRATRTVKVTPVEQIVEPTGLEKKLADAEDLFRARSLGPAREGWLAILQETDRKSIHAEAYYGLARIAALENNPELSERLFRKALELEPSARVKSWCLLYLGRLADAQGNRDQAKDHYQAALAVPDAPDAVRRSAQSGLSEAFKKKQE
jgi:hypothetical protein